MRHAGWVPRRAKTNQNDFFLGARTHFEEYERFRQCKKSTEDESVELAETKEKRRVGRSDMKSAVVVGECYFQAEISAKALLAYQLKIFCRFYGKAPCIRFDSRGVWHKNKEDGSGLASLRVPPPHFHKVDKDGWLRAYHTAELSDPLTAEAISKDLTLGTNHFCQEVKLSNPSGGVVVLKTMPHPAPVSTAGAMDAAKFPKK